jgi:hypothetical protein
MGDPKGFDISIHFEKWTFYVDFWLWYREPINDNRGYRWSWRNPFHLTTIPFADEGGDDGNY